MGPVLVQTTTHSTADTRFSWIIMIFITAMVNMPYPYNAQPSWKHHIISHGQLMCTIMRVVQIIEVLKGDKGYTLDVVTGAVFKMASLHHKSALIVLALFRLASGVMRIRIGVETFIQQLYFHKKQRHTSTHEPTKSSHFVCSLVWMFCLYCSLADLMARMSED